MIIKIKRIERRTVTEKVADITEARARVAELLLDDAVKSIKVINPLATQGGTALFIKLDVRGWWE